MAGWIENWQNTKRKKRFETIYGVELPDECRAQESGRVVSPGRFVLRFPYWKHAKADGTKDRRKKENEMIYPESVLWIGSFRIVCEQPVLLLRLAKQLRARGWEIGLCKEEREKARRRREEWSESFADITLQKLIRRFERDPVRFETYCATLFEKLGYTVTQTPASNDGGFDLRLERDGALFGLVECKLYQPSSKISRPVVQKLVGANELFQAPHLLIVTTSSFTKEAASFARCTHVQMVDGQALLALIESIAQKEEVPDPGVVELEAEDLRRCFPLDFEEVFQ